MAATNKVRWDLIANDKSMRGATKRTKKGFAGLSDATKRLGSAFAVAFGAREIVGFAKEAVDAASDYQESVNAVEVATGDASAAIIQMGDDSADAFGLSKTEINEAAVAFSGFAKKVNEDNVAGVFDELISRATDFGSVLNLETTDAVRIFQSTLSGETEPIRRFGFDLSAAAVAAEAVATGISATGKNMSETEKVRARFSLLMKETADFQGDFERTSDGAAGSQKRLAAKMKDIRIEIGTALLPAFEDLVEVLNEVADSSDGAIKKFTDFVSAGRTSGRMFQDLTDDTSGYVDKLDILRELSSDFVKTNLSLIPLLGDKLSGAFGRVETAVGLAGDKFEETVGAAGNVAEVINGRPMGDAIGRVEALGNAADTTAAQFFDLDDMVKIFSGNLFDLQAAIARTDVNKLFAGGGGSGEIREGQNVADATATNRQTGPS